MGFNIEILNKTFYIKSPVFVLVILSCSGVSFFGDNNYRLTHPKYLTNGNIILLDNQINTTFPTTEVICHFCLAEGQSVQKVLDLSKKIFHKVRLLGSKQSEEISSISHPHTLGVTQLLVIYTELNWIINMSVLLVGTPIRQTQKYASLALAENCSL